MAGTAWEVVLEAEASSRSGAIEGSQLGMNLVGNVLDIYWKLDKEWYRALVTHYDPESNCHRLHYDDGDVEEVDLSTETFRFVYSLIS